MNDFADRFRTRYSTLSSVWQSLAEGEMPGSLPAEWKSINYYAHVFCSDSDAAVKTAAQAFLRETDVARLDPRTFAERMMLATQTFAQAVCRAADIAWKEESLKRPPTAPAPPKPAPPKPRAKLKTTLKSNVKKTSPTTKARSRGGKTR